jgi:hypothetical protein
MIHFPTKYFHENMYLFKNIKEYKPSCQEELPTGARGMDERQVGRREKNQAKREGMGKDGRKKKERFTQI